MPSIPKTSAPARNRRGSPIPGRSACLLAVLLVMGCPTAPDGPRFVGAGHELPQDGGTLAFYHTSNVRGLDPHLAFDELSNMGIRLLFDGLLDYDHNAELIPSLAAQMPTVSEDGRRFVFHLRKGVRFHNGREMTAEDVRWSIERMLHVDVGSPGYTFFTNIDGLETYRRGKASSISGIDVLGRYTIEFRLKKPDQTFLNAMAMTFAYPVPRENYEAHPTDVAFHPVGTGPYLLTDWERGVRLIFERNDHYWKPGLPHVDRMVFIENLGRDVALMRFRNGDLEHAHTFTPADYLFFKNARKWQPYIVEEPTVTLFGITMNCEMPPFDNVHVRRAVAFAVDRERWSRSRNNRLLPTGQPLPPQLIGYRADLKHRQVYDLERAREEMRLAGFPNGLDEPITLWVGESPTSRFYGELAQADLEKIGIQVEIKQVAFALYLEASGKPKTVQAMISGWAQDFPDPADFLDILFHSRAIHPHDSENKSFYRNASLDAILDRARVEQDRQARTRFYEEASNIVARDAPWAFVWNDLRFEAWQPYLRNYRPHPVWSQHYREVWLDLPRRPARTRTTR